MISNEAQNGKMAYTATELLGDLYKSVFSTTIQGRPLNVIEKATQKGFIDALIIAADRNEVTKEKKSLDNENESFNSTKIYSGLKRVSESVSIKRGTLLRIERLMKSRLTSTDEATRYHYEDMLLRIDKSLR
jgi:hypothetical protein